MSPCTGVSALVDGRRVHVGNLGVDGEADWAASVLSRAGLDGAVVAWVRVDGELAGAILLADPLRPDAPRTLRSPERAPRMMKRDLDDDLFVDAEGRA